MFHHRVLEDFRANSRNLSSGVGLSMGLDAGPGYLMKIADELTIVGPPVVGAVRMVTAATEPWEIMANVFLGRRLHDGSRGAYAALGVTSTRTIRPSKEYPRGQEVYALTFASDDEGPDGPLISRPPAGPSRPATAASPTRPTPSGPDRPGAPPRCGA